MSVLKYGEVIALKHIQASEYQTAKTMFAKELKEFVKRYTTAAYLSLGDFDVKFEGGLNPLWRGCLSVYIATELEWPCDKYKFVEINGTEYVRFKTR